MPSLSTLERRRHFTPERGCSQGHTYLPDSIVSGQHSQHCTHHSCCSRAPHTSLRQRHGNTLINRGHEGKQAAHVTRAQALHRQRMLSRPGGSEEPLRCPPASVASQEAGVVLGRTCKSCTRVIPQGALQHQLPLTAPRRPPFASATPADCFCCSLTRVTCKQGTHRVR